MKKILLPVLIFGLAATAFSQEKWVLNPNNLKANTGRLLLDFPAGSNWTVNVWTMSNKIVGSVYNTDNKNVYMLPPGQYRVRLNTVTILNVPVQKGFDTKLRWGYLDIATNGNWVLADETKKTNYRSGNNPEKIMLPVGNYVLKASGQASIVHVEEFFQASRLSERSVIEKEQYILTPLPDAEEEGRLSLKFPLAQAAFVPVTIVMSVNQTGNEVYHCQTPYCPPTYSFPNGNYDIALGNNIDYPGAGRFKMWNIPIRTGYETSLKVGYLKFKANGMYQVYDESMQTEYMHYDHQGGGIYSVPPGKYRVRLVYGNNYRTTITYNNISVIDPLAPTEKDEQQWDMFTSKEKLPAGHGRLNCYIAEVYNQRYYIHVPSNSSPTGHTAILLDTLKSIDLMPGTYGASINGMLFDKVLIKPDNTTRMKMGYVKIAMIEGESYEIQNPFAPQNYGVVNKGEKAAFPMGYYYLKYGYKRYLIRIESMKLLEINPGTWDRSVEGSNSN